MQYILPIVLTALSYLFGVYFAYQGLRDVIDRPLAYRNETVILLLTILLGWIPILISLYLAYKTSGLIFVIILFLVRFILLPTILNDKIKIIMMKKGI